MNKGLTITLISLLSILLIGVVGIMIFLFNGKLDINIFSFSFGESKTLIEEKEIINIKKLNIESNRSDILIESSEEYNTIKIELYSDYAEKYEIVEKDDEIKIVLNDKKINAFNGKTSKINIYVPSSFDKKVTSNGKTGDIKIGDLPNSDLNVTLTTGDVVASNINDASISGTTGDIEIKKANDLTISLTTGDVEIGDVNNANIETTTGDIDVNSSDRIKVKLTTGDITLGNVNEYLNLTITTGDIKINTANIIENSKIKTGTGEVIINKTTGCYIEAKTKIGDINIVNNDRKSDIILTITSRVGDVKAN